MSGILPGLAIQNIRLTHLDRILGMKKGDIYDQTHIEKRLFSDDDAVTSQYMDEGYLFFSVDPVEVNIEGDSIDLEMRIIEGDPATINRVHHQRQYKNQ